MPMPHTAMERPAEAFRGPATGRMSGGGSTEAPLFKQMTALNCMVERLHNEIDRLVARLEPVLGPPAQPIASEKSEEPVRAPLTATIAQAMSQVAHANIRLSDLSERLEI